MRHLKVFIIFNFLFTFIFITSARINWRNVKPLHLLPRNYVRMTIYRPLNGYNIFHNGNSRNGYENIYRRHGAMKRIFGGNVALHNTFPYQVGLLLKSSRGLNWCGGSIISQDYIITAAHCLDIAEKALVFLGSYEIRNANEPGAKRIEVLQSHFIIYPGWDPKRLINDIALLKFPYSIQFSESIQPIRLPIKSFVPSSFAGKIATASGWGRYSTASPTISYSLRYVDLPILSQATCLSSYPFLLQPSNICTSGADGKSTCTGDSGGPLAIDGDDDFGSTSKILIGLTSFGSIFGCEKGYPGVYTRITSYLDWLSQITGIGNEKINDEDNDLIEKPEIQIDSEEDHFNIDHHNDPFDIDES